ncbi:hypothetical protein SAY87_018828 [Trapa incisa]|uniref:RING-type E3 ubiquitin transferase n=1 Tax=Trapa incisa TaxID=236973 RepID=A0AAN7K1H6_9MYRT|nr:hypothetical protein SAY87_018828 [Trapa incisa]
MSPKSTHSFSLLATVEADDSPVVASSESEEENHGHDRQSLVIMFEILHNDYIYSTYRYRYGPEYVVIEEFTNTASMKFHFRTSEAGGGVLMSSHDSTASTTEIFTSLANKVAWGRWEERTAEHLVWVADQVTNWLSGHFDGEFAPPADARAFKVNVCVDTKEAVRPEEGSVSSVIANYIRGIGEELRAVNPATATEYQPATVASIRELATVSLDDVDEGCSICTNDYRGGSDDDDTIVMMPCSHKYHWGCIVTWLEMNHTCPLCRFELPHDVAIVNRPEIYYF